MSSKYDLFDISPGKPGPGVVNVIVEIPKGRRSKFELDKKRGSLSSTDTCILRAIILVIMVLSHKHLLMTETP